MNVDLEVVRTLWLIVWPIVGVVGAWIVGRSKAARSEIDSIRSELAEADRRVERLETQVQHVPTKEQVHKLELGLADVRGGMQAQTETLRSVQASTARIETYLLERRP